MDKKEIEGAKQLIEIPDVKAGSYSFIGDSDVTYADIRILLDYIKDLEQENQKYKEVIDKAINFMKEYRKNQNAFKWNEQDYIDVIDEIDSILKEVE